jgi:hypothetical protein
MTLQNEGITAPPRVLRPFVEFDKDPEETAGSIIGPDENFIAMNARRQKDEAEGITEYVRSRLVELGRQLQQLPLRSGSAAKIPALVQETQKVLIGLPKPETQVPAL